MSDKEPRSGWCLKKSKTSRPWARAHHSHRFFVSRGYALSYFEHDSGKGDGAHLLGVIDLREVLRIRPTADATAPEHAIDVVLRKRTYTTLPQPPSIATRRGWALHWAATISPNLIDPALLAPADGSSATEPPNASADAMALSAPSAPAGGSAGALPADLPTAAAASSSSAAAPPPAAGALSWPAPKVLQQGFLLKLLFCEHLIAPLPASAGELTFRLEVHSREGGRDLPTELGAWVECDPRTELGSMPGSGVVALKSVSADHLRMQLFVQQEEARAS